MSEANSALPEHMFEEIVTMFLNRFGEEWIRNKGLSRSFATGTKSLLEDTDGIHIIGEPEIENDRINFNVWLDFPVEDLLVADDVAFDVFGRLAQEIFVSTRIIEDRSLRYRFLTGGAQVGHLGSINFTGPYAVEFVTMHRMKSIKGLHFNA